jgi:hypothetical protein
MKFQLKFDIDNAAFETDRNGEICQILRGVAHAIEAGFEPTLASTGTPCGVRDSNGNTVGCYQLTGKLR